MRSASGTQGPRPPGAPYEESSVAPLVLPLDNGALATGGTSTDPPRSHGWAWGDRAIYELQAVDTVVWVMQWFNHQALGSRSEVSKEPLDPSPA